MEIYVESTKSQVNTTSIAPLEIFDSKEEFLAKYPDFKIFMTALMLTKRASLDMGKYTLTACTGDYEYLYKVLARHKEMK